MKSQVCGSGHTKVCVCVCVKSQVCGSGHTKVCVCVCV